MGWKENDALIDAVQSGDVAACRAALDRSAAINCKASVRA
jgi:hypothetical protein